MAGSVNKVTLLGNVGSDPDIRVGQSGRKIASFSVATNDSWTDKASGEKKERTEWHRVVVFNEHLAKVVEDYVQKGDKIYLEGSNRTRKWQAQDGTDRYTTEIHIQAFGGELVLLGRPNGRERAQRRHRAMIAHRPQILTTRFRFEGAVVNQVRPGS
jgi:single-strand DNA-binding protein